jgi:hypothetical protein
MDYEKLIPNAKALKIKYNEICKKGIEKGLTLYDLTDEEFFIWIVGKTILFGRDLKASINNALCHMENPEAARKLFMRRDPEKRFI